MEPVAEEQAAVRPMRDLRVVGASYHAIAPTLSQRGVPTKLGERWSSKTIRAVLLRPDGAAVDAA